MARKLRNMALLLMAFAMATGTSYAIVRYLAQEALQEKRIDPETMREAQLLRAHTNELIDLMNEYTEHLPPETPAPSPRTKSWIDQTFRPRIDDHRLRQGEGSPIDTQAFINIIQATDTLATTAVHPADQHLRRRAASEIRNAAQTTQAHIEGLGIEVHMPHPPRKPLF